MREASRVIEIPRATPNAFSFYPDDKETMNTILLGILGYIVLQLILGVVVARRIRTESDFLLAGRNLGYALAIFSIFATWFGAESCIGTAGAV